MRMWGLCLVLLAAGCSSRGFNRGALRKHVTAQVPAGEVDIEKAFKKSGKLPRNFKIALYFKTPEASSPTKLWRWNGADKDFFIQEISSSAAGRDIASVEVLAPVQDSDALKDLRLAAAKQGADALLVVNGTADINRHLTPAAWSYLLVVPGFFAKGSQADALFFAHATLWNVRNGFLYLSAEAESERSEKYPYFSGPEDKDILAPVKESVLRELSQKVVAMMQGQK